MVRCANKPRLSFGPLIVSIGSSRRGGVGDETGSERLGAMVVVVALFWVAATMPLNPRPSGNPLEAVTPAQQQRAAQQAKENASDERDRSEWAERVARGDVTFAEAACVHERHGWWDKASETCDGSFNSHLPPRR